MKKVWILFAVEARGGTDVGAPSSPKLRRTPWGIYRTSKKAKKAMKEMEKDYYDAYIFEWELDE